MLTKLVLILLLLGLIPSCVNPHIRNTPEKSFKYIPCRDVSPIWTHELDTERTKAQVDEFNTAYDAACE